MTNTPALWALDRAAKECGWSGWNPARIGGGRNAAEAITLAARYIETLKGDVA
jgi:hypothetical protein